MPSLKDIVAVFDLSPTASLILYPDAPRFTVAEVNESFIQSVGVKRSDIIGKGIFEAFIENRDDTASNSGEVVKTSLNNALNRKHHKVRNQRYDLYYENGGFETRYWNWDTYPVLDDNNNVQFIVHNPVDVTETVTLINSEREKYQIVFNASPLPMWVYDTETLRFLDVNEAAIKHYGYSKEEFLGLTIRDIRPTEDVKILDEILSKRVRVGIFNKSSLRHLKKSGEEIFVNIESNSIAFGDKDARIVLATDITKKLNTELALLASEQRFKALVQNGSDLISILDKSGIFQYVSPASKLVLGTESDYFIGSNVIDFIHPNDRKRVLSQFLQLKSYKTVKILPFRFRETKNNFRWIETIITDMTDDPAVGGIVTNSRDVTESILNDIKIREGIERYNVVSKATNDAIYDWDLSSNKVKWNKGMQAIFGHKKTSASPDWWYNMIHPEDSQRIKKQAEIQVKNYKTRWKEEYRFRCVDGTYRVVLDRGFYMYDSEKRLVRMIGCMQDITEKTNYIRAIEEQNQRLREISWIQSHLVRSPLSRIMGIASLISNEETRVDAMNDLIPHLNSSAKELDDIIRNIIKKTERLEN